MDPEDTSQGLGGQDQRSPILSAFHVSFVGARVPEAQAETDDETGDSEEGRRHADFTGAIVLAAHDNVERGL